MRDESQRAAASSRDRPVDGGAADREFDADERREWNQKNEKLEELEKRRARVRELAGNPRAVVAGADDMKTGWNRVDGRGASSPRPATCARRR